MRVATAPASSGPGWLPSQNSKKPRLVPASDIIFALRGIAPRFRQSRSIGTSAYDQATNVRVGERSGRNTRPPGSGMASSAAQGGMHLQSPAPQTADRRQDRCRAELESRACSAPRSRSLHSLIASGLKPMPISLPVICGRKRERAIKRMKAGGPEDDFPPLGPRLRRIMS